ncbi:sigma-70 family RNA polymerase sigma factor [Tundrisphaera sp. TA3]|uniref:sigma-70 family RNA polymerase sigma factor n=1 Tax=Tundrisphaera sp. TA3 TaxID=3435775 RepID=UPI003EBDA7D4
MTTGRDGAVGRHLRMALDLGAARELSDGQLLERFAAGRGEAAEQAFAALVERHGPMVLRVARGILDDPHEAQDAFQATFLVLIARARGLWVRDSLGPWLHQAAHRTASRLRSNVARRRRLNLRVAIADEARRPEPADDSARVLHEEIDRLPERYRAPVVLCDLEGRTHEQAARSLGWPVGTVKSRQARARDRLRDRLARRGIAPGLALPALRPELLPMLPTALVGSTTAAAVRFVASRAIAPGTAAALAREVIRSMTILRWGKLAPALLALGVASGAGLLAQDRGDRPAGPPPPAEEGPARPADDPSVVEVRPGKLEHVILERGAVEASRKSDLICEVEGGATLIGIRPEGTRVKKGEMVAEFDSARLRDALTTQRIAVASAEAALNRAKPTREAAELALVEYVDGIGPRELQDLRGKVALARAGVEKGRERLARIGLARKRFDEAGARRAGPETPADIAADLALGDRLDEAELALRSQEFDVKSIEGRLMLLEKYSIPRTTNRLRADVMKARGEELARASACALELTRAGKIERQINLCRISAPGDGVLIQDDGPAYEEGATVRERQVLFRLVDQDAPMQVNTKVHESLVDRVRPGQAVRVKIDAMLNQVWDGVVQSVAPRPDPDPRASGRKVYTTIIQLAKAVPHLRPGMTALVGIPIFEVDDVLAVPLGAVVRIGNKDWVAVKTPAGAVEMREVSLGWANPQAVEVKQGLRPGDRVLLDPTSQAPARRRSMSPGGAARPSSG